MMMPVVCNVYMQLYVGWYIKKTLCIIKVVVVVIVLYHHHHHHHHRLSW